MDAPGVILQDNPSEQLYPMPLYAEGKIDTFVGRIRKDLIRQTDSTCGLFPIIY